MRLKHKPTLTGGLMLAGIRLLATPFPAAADERRHDITFGSQTSGSDRHRDDPRMGWQDGRDRWRGYTGGDRNGHRNRPGWAPNVEVIVDGVSSDDRRSLRDPLEGPDRCHQLRSDSWSTNMLDCPAPTPPTRSQDWSSAQ